MNYYFQYKNGQKHGQEHLKVLKDSLTKHINSLLQMEFNFQNKFIKFHLRQLIVCKIKVENLYLRIIVWHKNNLLRKNNKRVQQKVKYKK